MGIRTGTLRRAAAGAALLAVLVAGMPAPGRAAADSLVLAALHTLETSYVEPVDASALLDAAIAALRQATGLGEDLLPGIPRAPAQRKPPRPSPAPSTAPSRQAASTPDTSPSRPRPECSPPSTTATPTS